MQFKCDLHIHSVLSPCGSLYMSPSKIIEQAKKRGLDAIAITDHNSTLNCKIAHKLANLNDIFCFLGVEVCTIEEVHCLCYFEDFENLEKFQNILEENYLGFKNNSDKFGYQLIVDENENILGEVDELLISACKLSIYNLAKIVHDLGGLFIPAHVNREMYSIISQLGFIPENLNFDALEVSKHISNSQKQEISQQFPYHKIFSNSDAHILEDIGSIYTNIELENLNFKSLKAYITRKN